MESKSTRKLAASGKRPFFKPTLRVYGTVGEITGSLDGVSMPDGAGHPKNNMTRPRGGKDMSQ